ncbi:MAG TPA: ABC transporter permease [Micromonosporaceae bacterium]
MVSTATAEPTTRSAGAALAAQHGLSVAGTRPGLLTYTRELWSYRTFITRYSSAVITATFNRTKLGRLWQVLTPLSNAAIYYLIFGVVLNTKRDVPNFIAYLCAGVFVFGFTAQATAAGVQAITRNINMIRALHFPRATMPIATTYTTILNMGASMVVLIIIVLATGEPVTLKWGLLIPALGLQCVFNIGLGMIMARLGSKLPDLKQLIPFATRIWLYTSGVFYPASNFDTHLPGFAAVIAEANPAVVYIDLVRHALIHNETLLHSPLHTWILAIGWAVVTFLGGYIYFWRGEGEYGRG